MTLAGMLERACAAYSEALTAKLPIDAHASGCAVCHTGLEPRTVRPQTGLYATHTFEPRLGQVLLSLARAGHVTEAVGVLDLAAEQGVRLAPSLQEERGLWLYCFERGVQDDAATWPMYEHLFSNASPSTAGRKVRGRRGPLSRPRPTPRTWSKEGAKVGTESVLTPLQCCHRLNRSVI